MYLAYRAACPTCGNDCMWTSHLRVDQGNGATTVTVECSDCPPVDTDAIPT